MHDNIHILLVDDELPALENLEQATRKACPSAKVRAESTAAAALSCAKRKRFDVALLDIEMPEMTGLELSRRLKAINPEINIIFVTAHPSYAVDAIQERISGYLLKPVSAKDIKNEIENLRFPVEESSSKLYVRCFGRFEVLDNGVPIKFNRSTEKEIFAYLVDLKGDGANTDEICGILWEDPEERARRKDYFRVLINGLVRTLNAYEPNIIIKQRNYFSVDKSKIDCDYYKFLAGDESVLAEYHGEYMSQYSWSEYSIAKTLLPKP